MSRIGKLPISIPAGVTVTVSGNEVAVKGPKGELKQTINPIISVEVNGNEIVCTRPNDEKQTKAMHGLYRVLINNMVVGVSQGYKQTLELVGVGYRVSNQGQVIEFALGYTHNIFLKLPNEVKVETKSATEILVSGIDKQAVGQVAAVIRSVREPEPYLGKGIAYKGERIRRKEGKKAGKK